jgi:hypothetical protein
MDEPSPRFDQIYKHHGSAGKGAGVTAGYFPRSSFVHLMGVGDLQFNGLKGNQTIRGASLKEE